MAKCKKKNELPGTIPYVFTLTTLKYNIISIVNTQRMSGHATLKWHEFMECTTEASIMLNYKLLYIYESALSVTSKVMQDFIAQSLSCENNIHYSLNI